MSNRIVRYARIFLVLFLIGCMYRGYWVYSTTDHTYGDAPYLAFVHGVGAARFQYRALPIQIAYIFYQHLHWPFRYALALEDTLTAFTGSLLGFELLIRRPFYRQLTVSLQAVATFSYCAAVFFLFAWQDAFKKPETDSAACFAVLLLLAWTPRSLGSWWRRPAGIATSCTVILVLAFAESFFRADVALSLSLGTLFVAILGTRGELAIPRRLAIGVAAVSVLLAAGAQEFLAKVIYPNARPYRGPLLLLPYDVFHPIEVTLYLVYLAPSAWALMRAWKLRFDEDAASLGFAVGIVPFALLWALLGRFEEVRIFLPIGLAVAPLVAQMAARTAADDQASAPVST